MTATIKHADIPRKWLRRVAVQFVEQGRSRRATARLLGVCPHSVNTWVKAFRQGGEAALVDKPRSGRPPKLKAAQKELLVEKLLEGPVAAGFTSDLWTLPMIQKVIQQEFNVHYHVDHLGRFMHALGWTPQRPVRMARERNDAEVERFRRYVWPQLRRQQKKGEERTLSLHSLTSAASPTSHLCVAAGRREPRPASCGSRAPGTS